MNGYEFLGCRNVLVEPTGRKRGEPEPLRAAGPVAVQPPVPGSLHETESACMRDIPKRREDLTLPDALAGNGLYGYTCIRLRLEEVSQQPPIPP